MSVIQSPSTDLGKELAKWEQFPSKFTSDEVPPGNPYVYRAYPKMLYKAQYHPLKKKMVCCEVPPNNVDYATQAEIDRAERFVMQFNLSCQKTVQNEDEKRVAMNDGWCESPTLALADCEARRKGVADETAKREYNDQTMSARARAEARAADDADGEHVPDVPAPRKRRGRKPGAPMVTVPAMPETE